MISSMLASVGNYIWGSTHIARLIGLGVALLLALSVAIGRGWTRITQRLKKRD